MFYQSRALLVLFAFLFASSLVAQDPKNPDPADAFDVSQETVVGLGSAVYPEGFSLRDLLGARESTFNNNGEIGNTIFNDTPPIDQVDFVEFETKHWVRLQGYHLYLWGDSLGGRWTTSFTLKYFNSTNQSWVVADTFSPHPIPELTPLNISGPWGSNDCLRTLPQKVFAKQWRAEFLRDMTVRKTGPRITELDAISDPNTELPEVRLLKPAPASEFTGPAEIEFSADASDPDGIARVEYIANGTVVAESFDPADLGAKWLNPPPGDYTIVTRATDRLGGVRESDIISIKVNPAIVEPILQTQTRYNASRQLQFVITNLNPHEETIVEVSENLVTWRDLETFTPTESSYEYTDIQTQPGKPFLFYRVRQGSAPPPLP